MKKGALTVRDNDEHGNMTEDGVDNDIKQKEDKPVSQNISNELKRLNTFYNPTLKDVVDSTMVGRTDQKYVNTVKFRNAWYHTDE